MARLLSMLALPICAFLFAASPAKPSKPTRVPLTTSRVVGSPDAPPPYRTKRVFAKQTLKLPVYLASNPAHDLLFVVEQNGRIVHFAPGSDKPATEFVKLADADTYSMTFHAGGGRKNRMVSTKIVLDKGNYVLHYVSDDSHSYNHWNVDPPDDPTMRHKPPSNRHQS